MRLNAGNAWKSTWLALALRVNPITVCALQASVAGLDEVRFVAAGSLGSAEEVPGDVVHSLRIAVDVVAVSGAVHEMCVAD